MVFVGEHLYSQENLFSSHVVFTYSFVPLFDLRLRAKLLILYALIFVEAQIRTLNSNCVSGTTILFSSGPRRLAVMI